VVVSMAARFSRKPGTAILPEVPEPPNALNSGDSMTRSPHERVSMRARVSVVVGVGVLGGVPGGGALVTLGDLGAATDEPVELRPALGERGEILDLCVEALALVAVTLDAGALVVGEGTLALGGGGEHRVGGVGNLGTLRNERVGICGGCGGHFRAPLGGGG
jgi:hypothetical protein